MGKVQVLDKHTAELIAAGEVVERPSSVVKELLENSIDAGAHAVTVEIKAGGVSYIRITDDGDGIAHEDVPVAFLRHATSKIRKDADLGSISTLGFRGEALASIAAVSKVELITRTKDEEFGTHYLIEGGEQKEYDECGCAYGTTIIIRDIFYNTPARMKFLKKDVAEGNSVAGLLDRIALSHPEISLRFIREGKQALLTSGDGKLMSAVYSVYGREFSAGLMPVEYELNGVKVSGFTSKPAQSRPNTTMQTFFINGRYCRSRTMQTALEEAYKGSIMIGKHPSCVLGISIDCSAVDVNVHPAKLEVRFTNERPVYEAVYYAVKSALKKMDERSRIELARQEEAVYGKSFEQLSARPRQPVPLQTVIGAPARETAAASGVPYPSPGKPDNTANISYTVNNSDGTDVPAVLNDGGSHEELPDVFREYLAPAHFPSYSARISPDAARDPLADDGTGVIGTPSDISFSPLDSETTAGIIADDQIRDPILPENASAGDTDSRTAPRDPFELPSYTLIGEAFRTYIILESGDKLILIDKHAAHERLIYEKLAGSGKGREPQLLLEPLNVTLDKQEYLRVLDNRELLEEAGFEVDDFGSGAVLLRSVPAVMTGCDPAEAFLEIAARLENRHNAVKSDILDNMFHTMACRAAIKGHDNNTPDELAALVSQLMADPGVRYCPHGRPIYVELTKRELEKNFGRIQ